MNELLVSPHQLGWIVVRTVVVYVFVLAGLRLTGKREVGQLAPFDFALILLIANAVQNAMVGPDTSLVGGLVAAGMLLLINYTLGRVAAANRTVEKLVRGKARILVYRGQVQDDALHCERMSREELMQALRENGCAAVCDCRLAVLEVDGTVSVLQYPDGAHANSAAATR
jgi:uncharacterized membrane protein YcaP (DUF421 family)